MEVMSAAFFAVNHISEAFEVFLTDRTSEFFGQLYACHLCVLWLPNRFFLSGREQAVAQQPVYFGIDEGELPDYGVVWKDSEDFEQDVEGVDAVLGTASTAGTAVG